MIIGIERVAIYAKDTAGLRDWYIKMFDFREVYDNGKGTYFLMAPDGAMIEFAKAEECDPVQSPKMIGIRHLALTVDHFEAMVDKLKAEKVEIVSDVVVSSSGVKTFFFRDSEGNILHLIFRSKPLC